MALIVFLLMAMNYIVSPQDYNSLSPAEQQNLTEIIIIEDLHM